MLKNKLYLAVYLILVFTFLLSNCKMFGQTITVDNNMAIISFNNSTSTVTTDKQQSILTKIKQRETTKSIKIFKVENDNIAEIANCSSFRFGKNNEVVYSINDNETNMQKGSISFWKGKQTKAIGNTTILVFEGDDITGSVWLNDQLYKIEPLGDGLHAFIEIDPSKILNESPPIEINEEQNNNKQNKVNKIKSTTSAVIDVLVAYTTAAKNASGNISSLIQLAVAEANQSYENGDVSVRINLVYSYEVSYTESGVMATDLINFRGTSDGEMDEVHTYRNQYGADVCVLIVSSGNSCGRSYQTPTSSYAFAVVKYSCATGNYTFAHEIGHIQNCRHDICNDPAGSYNHGYEYCSGNWRTIMAYDTSCCTNHTTRLQYWSNPDITYNGVAMGTVQDEDNARMLDYYSPTVEAFKSTFASGELAANQTWYYKELSGNVTVPLGKTLTIPSSSTINLNGYSITTDGGTIDVSSGATLNGLKAKVYSSELKGICGTLQAAIDIASAQESIVVSEGTINEDISIVGKTNLNIHDVDLNGDISMTNSDYMVLQDNTCNNIYISNCDYPWIWSVVVEGSGSGNGVSMYNVAHLSQYGNSSITVDNFENGLYAISVTFGMENLINSAFTRVDNGVVGYANANITLNSVELCSVSDYHLISSYGSYIYANGCYYNGGTPIIQESGGTVETVSNQSCASLSKRNTSEEIMTAYSTDEFEKINNQLRELSKRISSEMEEIGKFNAKDYKDEILDIADLYTQYATNTESKYRGAAITTAVHCYKGIEEYEAMKAFLEELENDSEIGGYAKRYMIDYYQEQNDYDRALSIADELLEEEKADIDLTNTVLYAKGLLLAHDMNKPEAAAECFSILLQKTTNEGFIALAQNELRILGYEESVKKEDSETVLADEEELSISNYPNPFNPTTTISYTLPEEGRVQIKVYDILGREVETLVNEIRTAGTHKVEFNASHLPSGVYLYKIETSQGMLTKKMLLLK